LGKGVKGERVRRSHFLFGDGDKKKGKLTI